LSDAPDALTDALRHLLQATGVSRVYIFENFVDDGTLCMRQTAEVCAAGVDPQIDNPQLQHLSYQEASPRLAAHLSQGKHFGSRVSTLMPQERPLLDAQGILSLLVLPIQVEGEWYGYIGFDDCECDREWQAEDIRLLYTAAEMIGNYIARMRSEEKLKQYAADLKRSNEDLQQFAYVISHDLQEPARMVKGYMDLLAQRCGDQLDAKAGEYVAYAVDGAERMQEMIRALLRLSRVKTRGEAFAPTDVEAVLARTLNTLRRSIKDAGAEVTHDPLPTLMADGAQLTQVLQNLITNGIKFCREDEPPRVHVSAQREGDEWVFSVADNGIGIDPEQADRLFQIFQRLHTRREYPGTGIGLALCRRIVERHGGRIWVESEPGQGATFYFTLPDREESVGGGTLGKL